MVTGTTEVEMAPIQNGFTSASDKQELVRHNDSLNSFISESNEVTVTRWIDQRKYSMMSFKPCEKNVVDIVVTTGECSHGKQVLLLKDFTSQDIRSQYSTKAKLGFSFILLLLLVMIFIIIIAMVTQPWNNVQDGQVEHTHEILKDIVTVENNGTTMTSANFTYT